MGVLVPSVISVAVMVAVPAVLSVTLNVCVPPLSAALAGKVALLSLEVMPTVSVALTRFQFASTALTVTLNAAPAVRAVGVPVLPDGVPGAAVSPGINSCSFANGPATTVVTTRLEAAEPSLLEAFGSLVLEVLETVLVRLLTTVGVVTVMVKLVVAALAKLGNPQITTPPALVSPPEALTKVTPVGKTSLTTTLLAVFGPRLVTVIV